MKQKVQSLNKISTLSSKWLDELSESIESVGFAVVKDVVPSSLIETLKESLFEAQQKIKECIEPERIKRAGEKGVIRLSCKYSPSLLKVLEINEILQIVDHFLSPAAILHLQNGFILKPEPSAINFSEVFQQKFHMDFPRVLNGYLCSINIFVPLIDFTEKNGATLVVPGTHQKERPFSLDFLKKYAIPVLANKGDLIVFDSTLWHASGRNYTNEDRLALNHQFTPAYFKQQIDYVRALGKDVILELPSRTQQLLGYYSRVVTSLDEYYQPSEKRLYRANQG